MSPINFSDIEAAIADGNARRTESLVQQALADGVDPSELLHKAIEPGAHTIERYQSDEYFVPELLIVSRAVRTALNIVESRFFAKEAGQSGRVVIGTVQGDLHELGKNLVTASLQCDGFSVTDLGVDVPPAHFVRAVQERDAKIVAMSSLLTSTREQMREVLRALEKAGARAQTGVMVGGAGITQEFADDIGADGYAPNARAAALLAKKLVRR